MSSENTNTFTKENLNTYLSELAKQYRKLCSGIDCDFEEKSMINMAEILQEEDKDTLVLMTCAGEDLGNGDSTHRLLVTATGE
mgnify:CR=1 FL=1